MKLNFSENPKNCRISTYLTADEALELQKLIGDKSVASWLRDMVLTAIIDQRAFSELKEKRNGKEIH